MRSRMLLVALAASPLAFLPFAPASVDPVVDAPPVGNPSSSVVAGAISPSQLPEKPFARFALRVGATADGRSYLVADARLVLSPDLRHLMNDPSYSTLGGRRWDVLSGVRVRDADRRYLPNVRNASQFLASDDKRVWVTAVGVSEHKRKGYSRHAVYVYTDARPDGVSVGEDEAGDVYPLAVSADGAMLYAVVGHEVQAWSTDPVRFVHTLCPVATREVSTPAGANSLPEGIPAGGNIRQVSRPLTYDPQTFRVVPSPDGRFVAVLADDELHHEWLGGFCGNEMPPQPYHWYGYSPATGRIYRTDDWTVTCEFREEPSYREYGWTPDGRFASRTFDPRHGWEKHPYADGPFDFHSVCRHPLTGLVETHRRSPEREWAATACATTRDGRWAVAWKGGEFALFDLHSARPPRAVDTGAAIVRVTLSSDEKVAVIRHRDTVSLYDLCGVTKPPAGYAIGQLWGDLISDDPLTVYRAARWAVEHPAEAVPLVRREAERREVVSAERVSRWIADLSDPHFPTRHSATVQLAEHLEAARPALERTVPATPEAEQRLAELLAKPDPATPETRRSRWAVFVLEQIHSTEAVAVLRRWAECSFPFGLSAEAKEAIKRIDAGRSAP